MNTPTTHTEPTSVPVQAQASNGARTAQGRPSPLQSSRS